MENREGDHSFYIPSVEQIEILTRNIDWVRALAGHLVGGAHLAEDLAQDLAPRPPSRGPVCPRGRRDRFGVAVRSQEGGCVRYE